MTLWQDDKGHTSAMRLIAICGAFAGIGGLIASIFAMFFHYQAATVMAGICVGVITTAMGLKWAQKREEVKAP